MPRVTFRGTAGDNGAVDLKPTLLVGTAYSDSASGTCETGGSCEIGVTDSNNSAIGASASVGFASPTISLKETTNVIGNYVDAVKAAGFPIGDTIVAQECDPGLVIPSGECFKLRQLNADFRSGGPERQSRLQLHRGDSASRRGLLRQF